MERLPFDKPGQFWRGNLHTHSTRSDGKLRPEEVCRLYRDNGYDFLSLTDHFLAQYDYPIVDTRGMRSETFTTLIGAELHTGETELGGMWHLLAVGLPLDFAQPQEGETAREMAERARTAGAYVAAAHPQWYALTEQDLAELGPVDAIEVYNGVAIDHNDRPDSWHIADVMLGRGHRYLICATDDFHHIRNRADFMRAWVWVKSERLEPEALLSSLKAGHYYSSTGPQIHDVQIEPGNRVVVRCSPVEWIFVTGKGPVSAAEGGHGLTEAVISLSTFRSPYGRITVRDASGGRAWTNPIWFD